MRMRRVVVLLVCVGLVAGACGGSDADGAPRPGEAPVATSGGEPTAGSDVATLPVAAVTPPNPPSPSFVAGSPEDQAAEYAARFSQRGPEFLGNVLGAFAAAGVPVVGQNERNLVGRSDDVTGLPWWFVWTVEASAPTTRVSLLDMGAATGLLPPYDVPIEVVADSLLDGLRKGMVSDDPAERFVAHLVAESSRQAGGADPMDEDATARRVLLDLPAAYVYVGALFRTEMAVVAASETSAGAPSPVTGRLASRRLGPGTSALVTLPDCSEDGLSGWAIYVASKIASGASIGDGVGFKGLFSWAAERAGALRLGDAASEYADRLSKKAGVALAAVNVLALLATYSSLTAEAAISVSPLERHKKRSQGDGKAADVTVALLFDHGTGGEEAAQAINCLLLMYVALGNNTTIPQEGPAAGLEVVFEPGENMAGGFQGSGLVMWGPDIVQLKQETDANGVVDIGVQGRRQKRDYPANARPVDKEFSIRVTAQLAPVTGSSIGQTSLDALFCAGGVFAGGAGGAGEALVGCVDYAVNVLKTVHWDLGEFTFPLIDWAAGWRIDEVVDGWRAEGTVCDLAKPFEFTWVTDGGGGVVSAAPDGAGGGSYSFNGQMAGLPTTGSGPIRVDDSADPPTVYMGKGTWTIQSPVGPVSRPNSTDATFTLIPDAGGSCE